MTGSNDMSARLEDIIASASGGAEQGPFQIIGGGTKHFLGREASGAPLSVAEHRGIVSFEPKELVITARCGTRLAEIESILAERHQMLPFEPPHFGAEATLGGTICAGLSGPRRPYTGSARDFVLGVRLLNERGGQRFGGQVMKNVAGYDVGRLMVGAMGTLGILLEVSLRVLPIPAEEITLVREHTPAEAIDVMNTWAGRPLPLSGACFDSERLYVRLSGAASAMRSARGQLGGELLEPTDGPGLDGPEGPDSSSNRDNNGNDHDRDRNHHHRFWYDVREQRHAFFPEMTASEPLWRLSVPPASPPLPLSGRWFIEWGGGQRWLRSDLPGIEIRKAVSAVRGHATLFRGGDRKGEVFHPLAPGLARLHQRVKQAFDPHGLFNPGRLYSTL
uniref:Glycolate oxidase FAD binding subunit n=1 Tax=Candidatus Kentrum sp. LFY TaxID=2126342 RepID=A0A450WH90_9GAMM|nr:MAG: glycolate oxidase FAD binding subunit [Candidatus Kentron sp. LFY]